MGWREQLFLEGYIVRAPSKWVTWHISYFFAHLSTCTNSRCTFQRGDERYGVASIDPEGSSEHSRPIRLSYEKCHMPQVPSVKHSQTFGTVKLPKEEKCRSAAVSSTVLKYMSQKKCCSFVEVV